MFSRYTRVSPVNFITIDEAKKQLNIIDFDDDDGYILSLINVAYEAAERYMGRLLSQCTVEAEFGSALSCVFLPYPPVASITSVKIGEDDVTYDFSVYSNRLTITDPLVDDYSNVVVTYTAGFPDAANIPAMIKHAVKIMIGDMYANRESTDVEGGKAVPLTAMTMLDAYRILSI